MNVTTYGHWRSHGLDVRFLDENALHNGAELLQVRFRDAESLLEKLDPLVHHPAESVQVAIKLPLHLMRCHLRPPLLAELCAEFGE